MSSLQRVEAQPNLHHSALHCIALHSFMLTFRWHHALLHQVAVGSMGQFHDSPCFVSYLPITCTWTRCCQQEARSLQAQNQAPAAYLPLLPLHSNQLHSVPSCACRPPNMAASGSHMRMATIAVGLLFLVLAAGPSTAGEWRARTLLMLQMPTTPPIWPQVPCQCCRSRNLTAS